MSEQDKFLEELFAGKIQLPEKPAVVEETPAPYSSKEEEEKKKIEEEVDKESGGDKKDEDDDQLFISEENDAQEKLEEAFQNLQQDVSEVIEELKTRKNQQRNLDRETGGLEAEEPKEISGKDVWDDRSEEVDRMAVEVFTTSGMKSVVWQQKKKRLAEKKIEHAADAVEAHKIARKNNLDVKQEFAAKPEKMSFLEQVKAGQDRSSAFDEGRGR